MMKSITGFGCRIELMEGKAKYTPKPGSDERDEETGKCNEQVALFPSCCERRAHDCTIGPICPYSEVNISL